MIPYHVEKKNFEDICDAIAEIFRKPDRKLPSEFVEANRRISPEANSKKGGPWRNLPFQVEPMDCAVDPDVQTTVLQWAAQTGGKTEVINGVIGYFIKQEPSPILMVQPTLEMAEAWSKDRLSTMIRDTPPLAELFAGRRQRKSGQKILHKTFPGGHVTTAGANSPSSLASRPVRVTLFDEVDRYPESAGTEGDPVLLGEKRSDSFPDAVSFKTSTPTIRNHSRIEKEFELSDKRYWFVDCPHCGFTQRLKWANVKWPSDDRTAETYYLCESADCGAHWTDEERVDAVWEGKWVPTAPFRGIRGYHLNGIYSLFGAKTGFASRLHQMAEEFLKAKRLGKESLKTWTNTFLAETWEEDSDVKPDWSKLFDRRERYYPCADARGKRLPVPKGVIKIYAGIDIQADRIEMEVVGFGRGEENWGLGKHVIWGDTRKPQIYKDAETALNVEYIREDGITMRMTACGWDTGFSQSHRQLYPFLRTRLGRKFYAFKGSNQLDAEPISRAAKSKTDKVKIILVGTNRIKSYIYNDATIAEPGPGFMHFPDTYVPEDFRQMFSEDSTTRTINGQHIRIFELPSITPDGGTDRNEGLDCRVYARAAMYASGVPNWEAEESRMNSQHRRSTSDSTVKSEDLLDLGKNRLVTLQRVPSPVVKPSDGRRVFKRTSSMVSGALG